MVHICGNIMMYFFCMHPAAFRLSYHSAFLSQSLDPDRASWMRGPAMRKHSPHLAITVDSHPCRGTAWESLCVHDHNTYLRSA